MAVDAAEMGQPSTAADPSAAREAQANTDTATTEAAEAPPPFDIDAYYAQFENAPEDVRQKLTERLLQAEPIRKQVSAESSRAIRRAQEQAAQERAQREQQELDYILADENHPRHYEELEKHGTARKDVATERVGIRAAIERPEVRSAARVEVGQYIVSKLMQSGALEGVTEEDWGQALQAEDFPSALEAVVAKKLEREKQAWLGQYEPAIRAKTLDDYRAGLPNPDAGRSVTLPRSGPLTAAQVAAMTPEEYRANKERLRAQLAS